MGRLTRQDVDDRFTANLDRVARLVQTYTTLVGPGAGRSSVEHADILRAAVILLHAALEDLLRSIEELRLPSAPETSFEAIQFVPFGKTDPRDMKDKLTLKELAAYRGQTVDDVIGKAIDHFLDRSNYNNIGDVKHAIRRVGIDPSFISNDDAADIESMMKRRHWIAHRADRNRVSGKGHHTAQSIGRSTVDAWIAVVKQFGNNVLTKL